MATRALHHLLDTAASRFPDNVAVEESDSGSIHYGELAHLSDRLRDRLFQLRVEPGDRVGICMRKSADAVASIFGIMKAGAAYVPADPTNPASRNAFIFHDCAVKILIVEARLAEGLRLEFSQVGFAPEMVVLEGTGAGAPLTKALDRLDAVSPASSVPSAIPESSRLAYILYTSGSTGRPKGVMLSHGNAACFIDWCSDVFKPNEHDRFSSHAPFHFDLSILDIYVSLKHGATLVLVEEQLGKEPARLAPWIAEKKITVWYSAPSILSLLAQFGKLDQHNYSSLRLVLFAGEVFPIKYLKLLKSLMPHPRYFNLYGPTETNVCTFYEVPHLIPGSQIEPVPIGRACSYCEPLVVNEAGTEVVRGAEGELCIAGPSVLEGYWNLPENTAKAFLAGRDTRWYRTGDIVVELPDGNYKFLGRRDRMIKKRGYRIELGEIEVALYRHPAIKEAAVLAFPDIDGVPVKAFTSSRDGSKLSVIELKKFCSENLPLYMVPDLFCSLESLPKTSTDKIDYQKLKSMK
ncbi:MAG: amino acid adenylation domain-containing protein [Verrucomicrobia bacterium]|nr:MAG: amino acid adenylation domain-containing protein [Verrucomicrobiota bacterium]